MSRAIRSFSLSGLPVVLGLACATVQPPKELVDARSEYEKASKGPTAKVNPAGLYEAKKSLDYANKAFDQDPKSDDTRDISYIALRKIQLANAQAKIELATQEKARAERERMAIEQAQQQKKQKLTEGELAEIRRKLAESEEQRRAEEEKLRATTQQLETEKQARLDAEKKAEEATANLAKIALVKQEQRGLVITLSGGVLFASGHYTILPNARAKLDEVAEALQKSEGESFLVEGHTDSRGSESVNQELSFRRAKTVRDYLVDRGVPAERIRAVGYGMTRPVADNTSAEGRANNRRVEIIIQRKGQAS